MTAESPKTVSRFEHDLLVILRYLFGNMANRQAVPLILAHQQAPPCLSRNCVELVKDTLKKGLILFLTRAGGWQTDRFLSQGEPVAGRIWDRVPLDYRQLTFSSNPLSFLIWLTSEKLTTPSERWSAQTPFTEADRLFFWLVFDRLRTEPDLLDPLRAMSVFSSNPYCWLFNPRDFVLNPETVTAPDFDELFQGSHPAFLECLQTLLTCHWIASERRKSMRIDWSTMKNQGLGEIALFTRFLPAAEKAGRTDLARFLLRALSTIIRYDATSADFWIRSLSPNQSLRLSERISIQQNALSLPQQAETFARWDRQSRTVGYFDEGYAASQLWKEEFESCEGALISARSKEFLQQLEPLRT